MSSPALMDGRGYSESYMTQHAAMVEEFPEAWPAIVAHYGPRLSEAVATLSPVQREVTSALLGGMSHREISVARGTSRQAQWKVVRAAVEALSRRLPTAATARRLALAGAFDADLDADPREPLRGPVVLSHNTQGRRFGDTSDTVSHLENPMASHPFTLAPGVTATVESITPERAEELLETKAENRPCSEPTVEKYTIDMRAGQWRLTHQGIALDTDGQLIDGEHRLHAIMRSGCTVRMVVTRGLTEADREAFDQGKGRTVADALRFSGHVDIPRAATSWIRVLTNLDARRHTIVSPATVRAERERLRPSIDWMLANGPKTRPLNRAPVIAAMIYAHSVAPEAVESFMPGYLSGAGLPEGSPVLCLRGYVLERLPGVREGERRTAWKTLRALQAHHRGESLVRLVDGPDGMEFFRKLHGTPLAAG